MNYLNNAQDLENEFNAMFPILVNHSGGTHSCETWGELEEWDCASGETWANFLDSVGFGADFSFQELESRGDDLMLEMYVKENINAYINGNVTDAIENFEIMLNDCDFDDVIGFLKDETGLKYTNAIIIKLLKGNY